MDFAATRAQAGQPLVRNEVMQNTQTRNCSDDRLHRTRILLSGKYRNAPFGPKGLFAFPALGAFF